jgi:hypothetical protein
MASMSAAAIDLLQREISNPDTQWSFGAVAETMRRPPITMMDLTKNRTFFDRK